ncbi:hypothetical protein B0I72DRAFT_139753 [Yarrowia lipolytica]|uniref:YALI0D15466p n=2 Tax=Yarrowia lipolytica TaxID=4952 RepID=Q6C900_YARLI|nr:YALI0D15466p [Yarrowia lipolytica CLIB122]AOW04108.1 hypothetical protein YALI1_D18982g [Yarrowia lipolytica]KAB8285089.1 hypothetical protein BKA91DRAFT_133790 [Yarrowia lipolytica]KAE8170862.1 hypothetical protein BKA90DRAFT_140105 [Yarrowia lipolytica]KAJ8054353.1 hypothetical protein LXG23DRAFT_36453 [Yarrowia lipolytica]QNP98372.1 Hypothetical protein YALI2_D00813g [Yarrowia lipolytica]|eukprot:XP_502862.2 YALI0D15466p [Yarrowia lipolytica CLIB122]
MSRFLRSFGLLKQAVTPGTTSHFAAATTSSVPPRLKAHTSEGDAALPFHDSVIYKLDDLKVRISETPTSTKKWEINIPGNDHPIKFKSKHDAVHFAIFQGWEFDVSQRER